MSVMKLLKALSSFLAFLKNFLAVALRKITWIFARVEVIMALGGFSALLLEPIRNEYIYDVITGGKNSSYCTGSNNSHSEEATNVEVSRWTLYLDLVLFLPASIAGVFLTSWGDRVGRKSAMRIPQVAMMISSVIFALVTHFKWPIETLLAVNFCGGAGGYYMVLLMQGFAYLSDITTEENRALRFLILETSLGIAVGIAGFVSGFWVDAMGLFVPIFSTAVINLIGFLLVFGLPDSNKKHHNETTGSVQSCETRRMVNEDSANESSHSSISSLIDASGGTKRKYSPLDLLKSVKRVYMTEYSHCEQCFGPEDEKKSYKNCEHGGGIHKGRIWRMWLYLMTYNLYMSVNVGTTVFQTLYFLSPPLCFSNVLVGIQLAIKYLGIALNPFFVLFYRRVLHMGNNLIILFGLIALVASYVVIAVATNHLHIMIGTVIMTLSLSSKPFIQAQLSSLVSDWEQGAAFALLSFSESLTMLIATAAFLLLYPILTPLFHGGCWLFAAGISCCSIVLITVVYVIDRRQQED